MLQALFKKKELAQELQAIPSNEERHPVIPREIHIFTKPVALQVEDDDRLKKYPGLHCWQVPRG